MYGFEHASCLYREEPNAGLPRSHVGIGEIEDRVGHIGNLGPGRSWLAFHGLEHLGGRDDEFALVNSLVGDELLQQDNLLNGYLHPEVAPSHHNSVGSINDLIDILYSFVVFNFADDLDVGSIHGVLILQDFPQVVDVFLGPGERNRNEVDPLLETEVYGIMLVPLGDCGQVNGRSRQAHVLPAPNFPVI